MERVNDIDLERPPKSQMITLIQREPRLIMLRLLTPQDVQLASSHPKGVSGAVKPVFVCVCIYIYIFFFLLSRIILAQKHTMCRRSYTPSRAASIENTSANEKTLKTFSLYSLKCAQSHAH